jgi:hypothetical protein
LTALYDGGLAEHRPATAQRATALLEGLRLGLSVAAPDWQQLRHQCSVLGLSIEWLTRDQARLAASQMEAHVRQLAELRDRTEPSALKNRFTAILDAVRRAGNDTLPPPLLRSRVAEYVQLGAGDSH